MEKELKFIQIATSESSSIDGSNGENLYGLTKDGEIYYFTEIRPDSETKIYGWKKLSTLNLDLYKASVNTPNR